MPSHDTDIAIIGAGLSGLATARLLAARGRRVLVLEARDRVGGRILSLPGSASSDFRYDLGPAWVWPHNGRMLQLIEQMHLPLMRQHSTGNLVFQDRTGAIRRDLDMATMGDALRIPGGLSRLTDALAAEFPARNLLLGHQVRGLEAAGSGIRLTGQTTDGPFELQANHVVLALPPRLAADQFTFAPALSDNIRQGLTSVPTWMAGHAKVVAVYESPFWRKQRLSGDAISHRGPLFEIHDASAEESPHGEAALFGFVAPGHASGISENDLAQNAVAQLTDLFGTAAQSPLKMLVKDWSKDLQTATGLDRPDLAGHQRYRPLTLTSAPWAGRLHLSGSETAAEHGGFLEGALEAAEQTVADIEMSPDSVRADAV